MGGWTTGVLVCCFIAALTLLGHDDLITFTCSLEDSLFVIVAEICSPL